MQMSEAQRTVGALPRRVWILWLQGIENAPLVVRRCQRTWSALNPTWEVVTLDSRCLQEWLDNETLECIKGLLPAQQSDMIRLELLARYGGVWADATTWCVAPLDSWLPDYMTSGFFAFHSLGNAFLLSSWFLASEPENLLAERLRWTLRSYWNGHRFHTGLLARCLVFALRVLLDRRISTTRYWFSPFVQDRLRLSPYFAFHHKFSQLVESDHLAADIWNRTSILTSDRPHFLQRCGLTNPLTTFAKNEIESPTSPIYKLTWKLPRGEVPAGSTLDYLMRVLA
jgi:Capsular polysaccharide synthesis protein